jgi:hypothetical protein
MTNPQDLTQSEIDQLDAEDYALFLAEGDDPFDSDAFSGDDIFDLDDEEWEAFLDSHKEFDL